MFSMYNPRRSRHRRPDFSLFLLLGAMVLPVLAVAQPNTPLAKLKAMAADTATAPPLAEAALLASQLVRPSLALEPYLKQLDALADELRPAINAEPEPVRKAAVMAAFIYGDEGFANSTVLPADVFVGLDRVLDRQQWNCVGMSLLYAALGNRVGLPLQVTSGHAHVLVSYQADPPFFIETTAGGGLQASREYLAEYLPFPCVNPDRYEVLDDRAAIAMTLTQMALAMQRDERTQLAGTLFDLAIAFSDTYAEAYAGRGFLRAEAENYDAAIADFDRAIELDPNFPEAFGGLGTVQRAQNNSAQAVEAYRTAVSLCPDDSTAVFNFGQLLYETGDLDGAVYTFRRYIELAPQDAEGYMRLAFALEDSGNLTGAAEAYQQVLRLAPNYVDAMINLAYVLEQMQNYEAGLDGYRRALTVQPNDVRAMAGVGRILARANRHDAALRIFREALQLYPNESFLWVDLGRVFEGAGDVKQALGAFREATRVDPTDAEAFHGLARMLQLAGIESEAQAALARARQLDAAGEVPEREPPTSAIPGADINDLFPVPEGAETPADSPEAATDGEAPAAGDPEMETAPPAGVPASPEVVPDAGDPTAPGAGVEPQPESPALAPEPAKIPAGDATAPPPIVPPEGRP